MSRPITNPGRWKKRAWERKRTRKMHARGLTAHGTPLKQVRMFFGPGRKARHQRAVRAKRVAAGLTILGKPRKNRRFHDLRDLPESERRKQRDRFYGLERRKRGLTLKGTPLQYAPRAVQLRYQTFRETGEVMQATPQPQADGHLSDN